MINLNLRFHKTQDSPRVIDDDLLKCHYDFFTFGQSLNVEDLKRIDAGLRASARCTFVYTNGSCHPFRLGTRRFRDIKTIAA
jgi:hypothetical protein